MRVVVLMGGDSPEREVSLRSGLAVADALRKAGCTARAVDLPRLPETSRMVRGADVAFIAIHGGFGEDGRLQAELERLGVPYTGSGPEACALAMDKAAAKARFVQAGVPTPPFRLVREGDPIRAHAQEVGFPLVVKPRAQGSSYGVSWHDDDSKLCLGVDLACSFGQEALLERAIRGREITVGILGDRPLPAIEIAAPRGVFDTDAKYRDPSTGYRVVEDALPAATAALAAHRALGCRWLSRVDVILEGDRPWVLEVNTVPGMTGRSLFPKAAAAAGVTFPELCRILVERALDSRLSKV